MATILIDPVITQSNGGHDVEIYGIDPSDHDCIHGRINGQKYRWNMNGVCRDATPDLNIDPNDDNVRDVVETVEKITGEQ